MIPQKNGNVPSCYKKALVRPLLKRSSLDQNDLKNYRSPFFQKEFKKKLSSANWEDILKSYYLKGPIKSVYGENRNTELALNDLGNNANKMKIENVFGIVGGALEYFR